MKKTDGYTKVILTGIFIMLCVMAMGDEPTKPAHASWGNEGATEMIVQVAGENTQVWHMRNGKIRICNGVYSRSGVTCDRWNKTVNSK